MRGRRLLGLAVLAGLGGTGVGAVQAPAQADCVYVVAYVTRENATPLYASNGCVVNTPWKQRVTTTQHLTEGGYLPNGSPNGFFIDARVPLPG